MSLWPLPASLTIMGLLPSHPGHAATLHPACSNSSSYMHHLLAYFPHSKFANFDPARMPHLKAHDTCCHVLKASVQLQECLACPHGFTNEMNGSSLLADCCVQKHDVALYNNRAQTSYNAMGTFLCGTDLWGVVSSDPVVYCVVDSCSS